MSLLHFNLASSVLTYDLEAEIFPTFTFIASAIVGLPSSPMHGCGTHMLQCLLTGVEVLASTLTNSLVLLLTRHFSVIVHTPLTMGWYQTHYCSAGGHTQQNCWAHTEQHWGANSHDVMFKMLVPYTKSF